MCQGLLPSRRHIEKREDPGDDVAGLLVSLGLNKLDRKCKRESGHYEGSRQIFAVNMAALSLEYFQLKCSLD